MLLYVMAKSCIHKQHCDASWLLRQRISDPNSLFSGQSLLNLVHHTNYTTVKFNDIWQSA